MQSTASAWFGINEEDCPLWLMGIIVFFVYSPLVWVRTVEYFANHYVLSMAMIFISVFITSIFALKIIHDNDGEPGPDFVPIREKTYWDMIGFAFFMFEGINLLIPVCNESKAKQLP